MRKILRVSGLLILFFILPVLLHAQSGANYTLYVNVEEFGSRQGYGSSFKPVTSARVSMAIRTFDGVEERFLRPTASQNVPVDNAGYAVFKNFLQGTHISVRASGYVPVVDREMKIGPCPGFEEETRKACYSVQIYKPEALEYQPPLPGSVHVAVLVQAPQSPVALTSAKIDILKDRKVVRSADTKNTQGKEGVVFLNLPIGKYEAYVTAPGFESQRSSFSVESGKEAWLPILLDIAREKPKTCPTGCTCVNGNIISCSGAGQNMQEGVFIAPDVAYQKAIEALKLHSVQKTEQKEVENKIIYEVTGIVRKKLLFVIPVSFSTKAAVNAQTGAVEKISRPWWNFLVW